MLVFSVAHLIPFRLTAPTNVTNTTTTKKTYSVCYTGDGAFWKWYGRNNTVLRAGVKYRMVCIFASYS